MRPQLLFPVLFLLTLSGFAQLPEARIDSMLNTVFTDVDGPGAVFLIAKAGKPIYRKAFGRANVELGSAMTPEHVFQIGSMTKQFTAIAILQLEEQGRLRVDDPVSKYLPDYPAGDKITIHHLLNHTSGIKDFTTMKRIQDIAQKDLSPQEVVNFFKNEPVISAPGEKFAYNNSGYVLLGYIIELVSGQSYESFVEKNIFEEAQMSNSRYASDVLTISNRAYGYNKKTSGYVNKSRISFHIPYASGALMSTVDDLLKWQIALKNNTLLGKTATAKAFTKYRLDNGEIVTYGYGWHLKDIGGMPTREHGGSIFGFKSMAIYIPEKDLYVVGLSNCDCNSPTQLVRDIAAVAIGHFK